MIGPSGAGKTALLLCLRQHGAVVHSFGERFSVEVSDPARLDQPAPSPVDGSRDSAAPQPGGRLGERRRRGFSFGLRFRFGQSQAPDVKLLPAPSSHSRTGGDERQPEGADGAAESPSVRGVSRFALELDQALRAGLQLPSTRDRIDQLALTLALRPLAGRLPGAGRRTRHVRLEVIDAGGDVLAPPAPDARWYDDEQDQPPLAAVEDPEARRRGDAGRAFLLDQMRTLDALVLCLPMAAGPMPQRERRALQDVLRWVETNAAKRLKTIIVAATQYERVFEDAGPQAYRQAATWNVARDRLRLRFETIWSDLAPVLADFNAAPRRRVLVQPVSAFGFVPYHGGANLDPTDGGLRTRAPSRPGDPRDAAAPYAFEAVQNHYWSPFLTLDPFVALATRELGRLTFLFEEVAPEAGEA